MKTLCTLKIVNIACSTKRKISTTQNQVLISFKHGIWAASVKWKSTSKIFSTLKMTYTGCSMKGAILLLVGVTPKVSRKENLLSGMWVASGKLK